MISLFLDSSTTLLAVGIAKDNILLDSVMYEAWQTQSEHLIPELNTLIEKYNISIKDIKEVVVSVGPGSYTGVRIALTVAKTIATALDIKVIPVSSLQVLKKNDEISICLINARSNRSYFSVCKGEQIIVKDCIKNNEEVLTFINEHKDYIVCGNTKYLNIEGYTSNIIEEMLSIKDKVEPCKDYLSLKPIYLKD